MGIRQIAIAKLLIELFKYGLKHDLPEQIAQKIELNWDKWMGEKRSEKLQRKFELFLHKFIARLTEELNKDGGKK